MTCEIVTKTLQLITAYQALCSAWIADGIANGITGRTCTITGDLRTLCDSLYVQILEGTRIIEPNPSPPFPVDPPDGPWIDTLIEIIETITDTLEEDTDEDICSLSLNSSGGDEGFDETYSAGNGGYTIVLTYETYYQKDQIILYDQASVVLFDSGCVGTQGERVSNIAVPAGTTSIRVRVIPNCEGGTGTAWYLQIRCL